VAALARPECSSQAAVDEGRPRKHVGRKKPKTDDEISGDPKNRKVTHDDDADVDVDAVEDNDGNEHSDTKLNGSDCYISVCFVCELLLIRVTTCLENLEMSGNYTDVREMLGISLKVMELSGKKSCHGKLPGNFHFCYHYEVIVVEYEHDSLIIDFNTSNTGMV